MKITEKQKAEFYAERNNFLEVIHTFSRGIKFTEEICKVECRKVYWIDDLRDKVNALGNLKKLESLDDIHYGMAISKYLNDIEKVFLEEFSNVISPFDNTLASYKRNVQRILIGEE